MARLEWNCSLSGKAQAAVRLTNPLLVGFFLRLLPPRRLMPRTRMIWDVSLSFAGNYKGQPRSISLSSPPSFTFSKEACKTWCYLKMTDSMRTVWLGAHRLERPTPSLSLLLCWIRGEPWPPPPPWGFAALSVARLQLLMQLYFQRSIVVAFCRKNLLLSEKCISLHFSRFWGF